MGMPTPCPQVVLPGERRVDTVSSGIAIQPEDWRRGCLAQDPHLGNVDPPREEVNSECPSWETRRRQLLAKEVPPFPPPLTLLNCLEPWG